jgi:hypothetical protein
LNFKEENISSLSKNRSEALLDKKRKEFESFG